MYLSEAVSGGPQFFALVPLIVLIPVVGLLINIILGGRMGEKAIGVIASLASGLTFVVSVLLAVSLLGHPEGETVVLAEWIKIGALELEWAFLVDTLSVTMMLVVSGVGTLIHIYAIGYMHEDVRFNGDLSRFRRFFVFMNLFIAAMMILVSGDNYLMLFVGWEGVGLCSYLLIGFWYDKGKDGIGNALAAKKAFVTNRVGDFGFLVAGFFIFWNFGSLKFVEVFEKAPSLALAAPGVIFAITMFMLLGVTGKSAQVPLFVWLPDAMAGPTPVSALIHAATMVTAGVYLVARSAPLYNTVPDAQNWVALTGAVTALLAATIAVAQFDIKKVLAYSTISQLGFMVAAVGVGAYVPAMFHLITHAFFKALLFLSSGSVILGVEHGLHHVEHDSKLRKQIKGGHLDPQDMRNMGGLRTRMPVTFWVYLIGALALAGIFPLAGFWSKDEILFTTWQNNAPVFWMLLIAAFFTAFYMTRQIILVFFGQPRTPAAEHARDNPPIVTVPLMVLAGLSVLGGVLNLPVLHSLEHWLEHTLARFSETAAAEGGALVETAAHSEGVLGFTWGGLDPVIAIGSTLLALAAIFVGYQVYTRRYAALQLLPVARRPDDPLREVLGPFFTWMNAKWYVDELYQFVILSPYQYISKFLADVVDWRFWHDWFHDVVIAAGYRLITRLLAVQIDLGGVDRFFNGLGSLVQNLAGRMRRLQVGFVRSYALSIFLGVVAILTYLVLR